MCRYILDYHHTLIRRPMQEFKKRILSQVSKSQDMDKIMRKMDREIARQEAEYQIERKIKFKREKSSSEDFTQIRKR